MNTSTPSLVSTVVKIFYGHFQDGTEPKDAVNDWLGEVLQTSVDLCEKALSADGSDDSTILNRVAPLVSFLNTFRESLFHDTELATVSTLRILLVWAILFSHESNIPIR